MSKSRSRSGVTRRTGARRGRVRRRSAAASAFLGSFSTEKSFFCVAGLYLVLALAVSSVFLTDFVKDDLVWPLQLFFAKGAALVLSLGGMVAVSDGSIVTVSGQPLEITHECIGIDATLLLLAAILVVPASCGAKLVGVVVSLGVMTVVNFLRVVTLCFVGSYSLILLELGHLYLWPIVVILVGLSTLLIWAFRVAVPQR